MTVHDGEMPIPAGDLKKMIDEDKKYDDGHDSRDSHKSRHPLPPPSWAGDLPSDLGPHGLHRRGPTDRSRKGL